MALQITKIYDNGFTSEYHKISNMHIDYNRNSIHVDVASYKDKATRDANMSPVDRKGYMFDIPQGFTEVDRPGIYSLLKTLPEFDGAIDV